MFTGSHDPVKIITFFGSMIIFFLNISNCSFRYQRKVIIIAELFCNIYGNLTTVLNTILFWSQSDLNLSQITFRMCCFCSRCYDNKIDLSSKYRVCKFKVYLMKTGYHYV